MKKVRVLLFASIREKVGKNSLELDIENNMDLKDFFQIIAKLNPELANISKKLNRNETIPYLLVLDGKQVNLANKNIIKPGAELGILPPVSGG